MPRHYNQKLKILLVLRLLMERSDGEHPISMEEILRFLRLRGVRAERKGIYDDITSLRLFGLDVCHSRGRHGGYYLGKRDFEFSELKLLTDLLYTSRFLTEKKTEALSRKLCSLLSIHQAEALKHRRSDPAAGKCGSESILSSLDCIQEGMRQDRQIRFRYFDYDPEKQKAFRKNGKPYQLSPYGLVVEDGLYYLLAYDGETPRLKHYRVDHMEESTVSEIPRAGGELFSDLDPARYARQSFSMFGGEESLVELEFENRLMGAVMDRFGKDVEIRRSDASHFRISVPVFLSPHFYAWLFAFGDAAAVLSPLKAIQGMEAMLKEGRKQYRRIRLERSEGKKRRRTEKEEKVCLS